jgi:hypothetical protein
MRNRSEQLASKEPPDGTTEKTSDLLHWPDPQRTAGAATPLKRVSNPVERDTKEISDQDGLRIGPRNSVGAELCMTLSQGHVEAQFDLLDRLWPGHR